MIPKVAVVILGWLSPTMWGSVVAVLDEQRLLRGYREIADTPKAAGEILAAFSVVG